MVTAYTIPLPAANHLLALVPGIRNFWHHTHAHRAHSLWLAKIRPYDVVAGQCNKIALMPEEIEPSTVSSQRKQRIQVLAVYPQAALFEIIKLYLMLGTIVS